MNEATLVAALKQALGAPTVKQTVVTGALARKPPASHNAPDFLRIDVKPGAPMLILRRIFEDSTTRTIEHTALLPGSNFVGKDHPKLLGGVLPEAFDPYAHLVTVSECGPNEKQSPAATYVITNRSTDTLTVGVGKILPPTPLARMLVAERNLPECLASIRYWLKLGKIDCVSAGGDELARLRTLPGPPEQQPASELEAEIAAANRG